MGAAKVPRRERRQCGRRRLRGATRKLAKGGAPRPHTAQAEEEKQEGKLPAPCLVTRKMGQNPKRQNDWLTCGKGVGDPEEASRSDRACTHLCGDGNGAVCVAQGRRNSELFVRPAHVSCAKTSGAIQWYRIVNPSGVLSPFRMSRTVVWITLWNSLHHLQRPSFLNSRHYWQVRC